MGYRQRWAEEAGHGGEGESWQWPHTSDEAYGGNGWTRDLMLVTPERMPLDRHPTLLEGDAVLLRTYEM